MHNVGSVDAKTEPVWAAGDGQAQLDWERAPRRIERAVRRLHRRRLDRIGGDHDRVAAAVSGRPATDFERAQRLEMGQRAAARGEAEEAGELRG